MKFAIEGHLTSGSYEKDGVRIPTVEVDVESIEFCEKKASVAEAREQFMEIPDGMEAEILFKQQGIIIDLNWDSIGSL